MHVLFVEDDAMNRRVVRDMLSVADVEMSEADGALKGIGMIEACDYDLVLMDLRMPGMDGLEALRRIRARMDAKGRVPVVVVTADIAPDLKTECLREGADDFLTKPIAMDALFDALGRLMARGAASC